MPESLTISREEPERHGPSYLTLREEGLRILRELAGDTWTDHNEHDPGITILEQLCYALTELSYRAGFPVADLLAGEGGAIDARRHALFPPVDAFSTEPVTLDDHRRLLADRVPAVGNVWISPAHDDPVRGLYDILLHVPGAAPQARNGSTPADDVRAEVAEVLRVHARHRGLCEDVRAVHVLDPVRTVVRAEITIDATRAPEIVLADVLFHVALLLAPEIRRQPLRALLARGLAPSEIFEGPLLRDGFVDDEELHPRPMRVRIAEITRTLARTPGVIGVRDVAARAGSHGEVTGDGALEAPRLGIFTLDTAPHHGGDFPIRLVRRGAPCKVDPARVRRELDRLWSDQRRRHPLAQSYEEAFPAPRGRERDLGHYTSIQDHFPDVYGINAAGPPDDATPLRIAQIRQLKGYLIVFEQLLADHFAQLARAKDLLSIDRALDRTYFHHPLSGSLRGAGDLLCEEYEASLDAALRGADPARSRRTRFLDVLLALHAESVDALPGEEPPEHRPIESRIALLERLPSLTRARGRGFDTTADPSIPRATPMEIRSRIELGLPALVPAPPPEGVAEDGCEIDEEPAYPRLYIVEHTLLRAAAEGAPAPRRGQREPDRPNFEYSFTLSAVISHAPDPDGGAAFEERAREVVRRNAPAHIDVEYCFLRPSQMRMFEKLHRTFREALHRRDDRADPAPGAPGHAPRGAPHAPAAPLARASAELRAFLERRRSPGS